MLLNVLCKGSKKVSGINVESETPRGDLSSNCDVLSNADSSVNTSSDSASKIYNTLLFSNGAQADNSAVIYEAADVGGPPDVEDETDDIITADDTPDSYDTSSSTDTIPQEENTVSACIVTERDDTSVFADITTDIDDISDEFSHTESSSEQDAGSPCQVTQGGSLALYSELEACGSVDSLDSFHGISIQSVALNIHEETLARTDGEHHADGGISSTLTNDLNDVGYIVYPNPFVITGVTSKFDLDHTNAGRSYYIETFSLGQEESVDKAVELETVEAGTEEESDRSVVDRISLIEHDKKFNSDLNCKQFYFESVEKPILEREADEDANNVFNDTAFVKEDDRESFDSSFEVPVDIGSKDLFPAILKSSNKSLQEELCVALSQNRLTDSREKTIGDNSIEYIGDSGDATEGCEKIKYLTDVVDEMNPSEIMENMEYDVDERNYKPYTNSFEEQKEVLNKTSTTTDYREQKESMENDVVSQSNECLSRGNGYGSEPITTNFVNDSKASKIVRPMDSVLDRVSDATETSQTPTLTYALCRYRWERTIHTESAYVTFVTTDNKNIDPVRLEWDERSLCYYSTEMKVTAGSYCGHLVIDNRFYPVEEISVKYYTFEIDLYVREDSEPTGLATQNQQPKEVSRPTPVNDTSDTLKIKSARKSPIHKSNLRMSEDLLSSGEISEIMDQRSESEGSINLSSRYEDLVRSQLNQTKNAIENATKDLEETQPSTGNSFLDDRGTPVGEDSVKQYQDGDATEFRSLKSEHDLAPDSQAASEQLRNSLLDDYLEKQSHYLSDSQSLSKDTERATSQDVIDDVLGIGQSRKMNYRSESLENNSAENSARQTPIYSAENGKPHTPQNSINSGSRPTSGAGSVRSAASAQPDSIHSTGRPESVNSIRSAHSSGRPGSALGSVHSGNSVSRNVLDDLINDALGRPTAGQASREGSVSAASLDQQEPFNRPPSVASRTSIRSGKEDSSHDNFGPSDSKLSDGARTPPEQIGDVISPADRHSPIRQEYLTGSIRSSLKRSPSASSNECNGSQRQTPQQDIISSAMRGSQEKLYSNSTGWQFGGIASDFGSNKSEQGSQAESISSEQELSQYYEGRQESPAANGNMAEYQLTQPVLPAIGTSPRFTPDHVRASLDSRVRVPLVGPIVKAGSLGSRSPVRTPASNASSRTVTPVNAESESSGKLRQLEHKLSEIQTERSCLLEENDRLRTELKRKDEPSLNKYNPNSPTTLQRKIDELNSQVQDLQEANEAAVTELRSTENKLASMERQNEQLVIAQSSRLRDMEDENIRLQAELRRVKESHAAHNEATDYRMKIELQQVREDNRNLRERNYQLHDENIRLQEELSQLRQSLEMVDSLKHSASYTSPANSRKSRLVDSRDRKEEKRNEDWSYTADRKPNYRSNDHKADYKTSDDKSDFRTTDYKTDHRGRGEVEYRLSKSYADWTHSEQKYHKNDSGHGDYRSGPEGQSEDKYHRGGGSLLADRARDKGPLRGRHRTSSSEQASVGLAYTAPVHSSRTPDRAKGYKTEPLLPSTAGYQDDGNMSDTPTDVLCSVQAADKLSGWTRSRQRRGSVDSEGSNISLSDLEEQVTTSILRKRSKSADSRELLRSMPGALSGSKGEMTLTRALSPAPSGLRSHTPRILATQHNKTALIGLSSSLNSLTQGLRPFAPRSANDLHNNDVVKFSRQGGKLSQGTVKFIGHLPGRGDIYLGVELDKEDGKHDGVFEDIRYFKCKPNKGVFVAYNKVVMAWTTLG